MLESKILSLSFLNSFYTTFKIIIKKTDNKMIEKNTFFKKLIMEFENKNHIPKIETKIGVKIIGGIIL